MDLELELELAAAAARVKLKRTTPDGRTTAPGTTAEQAARIPPGMVYDPKTGQYFDAALHAQRRGGGAAASFLSGAPFVGEFVDEGMGRLDAMVAGNNPEIMQEITRQSRQQYQTAHPGRAAAMEVAGGVLGAIPLAMGGAAAAGAVPGLLTRAAAGSLGGLASGAIEGAVSGYGRGTTQADRIEKARHGGLIGGALGGVLGGVAPLAGEGIKAAWRRAKRLDVATIADEFGLSRPAARIVKSALQEEDFAKAQQTISNLGGDAMLADAGPATGALLDAATKTGGRALRETRDAVEDRASRTGARLHSTLDSIFGQPKGVRTVARDIAQRTARLRDEAYTRAYSRPIDYASGAGRRIEEVLGRIPDRTLSAAVREANEAMKEAGQRNLQIVADIAPDGSVTFREMPNVQQLDAIKRALGEVGRNEVDDFGRPTAAGIRANRLAANLRDAIGDAVPIYRRAVRLGGDKIAEDNALKLGTGLFTRNVTLEDVQSAMRSASMEERQAAKLGIRNAIEEALSNVRRTITDPNVEAREAMKLVNDMSSRASRDKLRAVIGTAETDRFMRELDRSAAALQLRGVIARGSDTAIRQSIQGQVRAEVAPSAVTALRRGEVVPSAQRVMQALTGATDQAAAAREKALFDEIASALTRIRGPEAERALAVVQKALTGQPAKDDEARLVARVVATPLFLGAYQSGQQYLERP